VRRPGHAARGLQEATVETWRGAVRQFGEADLAQLWIQEDELATRHELEEVLARMPEIDRATVAGDHGLVATLIHASCAR
jgi:hypothetical protein